MNARTVRKIGRNTVIALVVTYTAAGTAIATLQWLIQTVMGEPYSRRHFLRDALTTPALLVAHYLP